MAEEKMMLVKGGFMAPGSCGDSSDKCSYYEAGAGKVTGKCQTNSNARCVCKGPNSSIISTECGDHGTY